MFLNCLVDTNNFRKKQLNYTFFNISDCILICYSVYSSLFIPPDHTQF